MEYLGWLFGVVLVLVWGFRQRFLVKDKKVEEVRSVQEMERMMDIIERHTKWGYWRWRLVDNKIVWSRGMYLIYQKPFNWDIDFDVLESMIHAEDLERVQDGREIQMKTLSVTKVRYRINTPVGVKHLEAVGIPEIDTDGQLTNIYGALIDVTEKVRMEQEKEILYNKVVLELSKYESAKELSDFLNEIK